ncbi:hypothetical protein KXW54_007679 [Aspergillus fumigatus]|nr:hypothetical protein KXW54_007679 [Aspergillus fumigatus]
MGPVDSAHDTVTRGNAVDGHKNQRLIPMAMSRYAAIWMAVPSWVRVSCFNASRNHSDDHSRPPGSPTRPGYAAPPGSPARPGYAAPPGYPAPPGYSARPGYPALPGSPARPAMQPTG